MQQQPSRQKSLQATDALKVSGKGVERVVSVPDNGVVKLAVRLRLPLSRCCLPLALRGAHTTLRRVVWDAQSRWSYAMPLHAAAMPSGMSAHN